MYQNASLSGGGARGGRGGRGARPYFSSRNQGGGKRRPAGIDPARFVSEAQGPVVEEVYNAKHKFVDFNFDPRLQANIDARGYTMPSPIQDGAIPFGLQGRDIIGLANTGTGKTAAFLLPILQRMLTGEAHRALILAPTRELADQIMSEFRLFAKGLPYYATLVVGGASMNRQQEGLRRKPQLIVATPGRLKDHLQNYRLKLTDIDVLVLDEADRMLDMGFIHDIQTIITHVPAVKQRLTFSATITPDIRRLLDNLLQNPETISVRSGETSKNVTQNVIRVQGREEKLIKLSELLRDPQFEKVLVFGETKFGVQRLADNLSRDGFRVQAIHGNKSQPQRQKALEAFRAGRVQALIATDVAARGLDIPKVSHVINYDTPHSYEDYIHRIGRTGRAGEVGQALTFV